MRDTIKLRVYSPTQGGGNGSFRLIWEKLLLDEEWLRTHFNDNSDRDGLKQGDLLCVGKKQCYII